MKTLVIGDVHAKVEDLDDCESLHKLIIDIAQKYSVDKIIYMGDQFNAHAVKHIEVERFWLEKFSVFKNQGTEVIVLVGNHDRPGNAASRANSLQSFKSYVTVVDEPIVRDSILFLPYYHSPEKMVEDANKFPNTKLIFCHSSFSGGHYDNGTAIKTDAFYGKDVVNPDDLPQSLIVSGHIHTSAKFGKVNYIGSPRWLTMSDANKERFIYVFDVDEFAGKYDIIKAESTGEVCNRTWQLDYFPDDLCENELAAVRFGDKVLLNIKGPLAFCEESKKVFSGKGYRTRVFSTDRGVVRVSEAEGISVAFNKHVANYQPKYGTSKKILENMLKERFYV